MITDIETQRYALNAFFYGYCKYKRNTAVNITHYGFLKKSLYFSNSSACKQAILKSGGHLYLKSYLDIDTS